MLVKGTSIIFNRISDWDYIHNHIIKEYGVNMVIISWRLKRELGFTVREHTGLTPWADNPQRFRYTNQIWLDFVNESALSFFILKYSHLVPDSKDPL